MANGSVYVPETGIVYALNATSGAAELSTGLAGSVDTAVTVADGTVYVGETTGGLFWTPTRSPVHALDTTDGTTRWTYDTAGAVTTLAVADGTVYAGISGGFAFALDGATGAAS